MDGLKTAVSFPDFVKWLRDVWSVAGMVSLWDLIRFAWVELAIVGTALFVFGWLLWSYLQASRQR